MSDRAEIVPEPCAECCGKTVEFRGNGRNLEYRVCSRYKEPGHITMLEIRAKVAAACGMARPSGRFA